MGYDLEPYQLKQGFRVRYSIVIMWGLPGAGGEFTVRGEPEKAPYSYLINTAL